MAKKTPKTYNTCTMIRTRFVRTETLNMASGETKETGGHWETAPCGIPLSGDADRTRGTCKGCAGGFTHPENYPAPLQTCERCGESLDPSKSVALELDSRTGLYIKPGLTPLSTSQGIFFFGSACAKAVLKNGGKLVRI